MFPQKEVKAIKNIVMLIPGLHEMKTTFSQTPTTANILQRRQFTRCCWSGITHISEETDSGRRETHRYIQNLGCRAGFDTQNVSYFKNLSRGRLDYVLFVVILDWKKFCCTVEIT